VIDTSQVNGDLVPEVHTPFLSLADEAAYVWPRGPEKGGRNMLTKPTKTDLAKLQTGLKRNERLLQTAYVKIEDLMGEAQISREQLAASRLARRRRSR
jgi:hypothetical protein